MTIATFVMEQHIGHRAFYENLRRFIDPAQHIQADWVEVTYNQPPSGIWDYLPLSEHIRGTLRGRAQVRNRLKNGQYDVAFFNTQVPALLGGQLVKNRPFVLCTDITPIQYDQMGEYYHHEADVSGMMQRYKHRSNRQMLQSAGRILPWSSWAKTSLIEDYGVNADKIEVLPPGVDIEKWQPNYTLRDDTKFRILFIGGDFQRKGGDTLLKAFQALNNPNAELHLVTRHPVAVSERVFVYNNFQPNDPKLVQLCQSCNVFALPTHAEAFGVAAIEAGAVGLPVIGTRIGGLTDIVKYNETGLLIDVGSVEQLTNAMAILINDAVLTKRLGVTGRKRVEVNFDAQKNARRVMEILQEVAE